MASKVYTAHELRDAADAVDQSYVNDFGEIFYDKLGRFNPDLVRDMLRQAAEIRERLDDSLLTFHSCPDDRDLLNYILHGDTGKEEK